jgi:hypothetical protein
MNRSCGVLGLVDRLMSLFTDGLKSYMARSKSASKLTCASLMVIPSEVEEPRYGIVRHGRGILRLRFASLRMTLHSEL